MNSSFHWYFLCGSISSKEGAACPLQGQAFGLTNCKDIPAMGDFGLWMVIKPENAKQFFCSISPECISNEAAYEENLCWLILSI